MQKIAVFGNAGGGKSTLARHLAEITGLPLHVIDILQYPGGSYQTTHVNGGKVSAEVFEKLHDDILRRDAWIIDGFENVAQAWKRFEAADTLIHVDLPIACHYWGVTKRMVRGLFKTPAGWPEHAPVLESSLASYRVIWRCHTRLTPRYRQLIAEATSKRTHRLTSYSDISRFLQIVGRDHRGVPTS